MAHLGFQRCRKLGAIGLQHRDVVLNRHGVVGLAAKTLSRHTHTDAFARSIDSRSRTSRATAHDQHVKGVFGAELGRVAFTGVGVQFGHDFFDRHAARAEHLAVEEDHGHRHDLALFHLFLKRAAFDHHGFDLRIDDGHERQSLHHVGAVVAAQRHVNLKIEVAFKGLDAVDDLGLDFGGMTAGPQQGQYQ